jgi:PAS domain-containing protein
METNENGVATQSATTPFVENFWDESWTYIKTVVDVVREPILILSKDFRVLAANDSFYRMFRVEPNDTERKVVYELGDGQWNIPALRKLLEDILPKHTFFKGFEVTHEFPVIGRKVMILNARRIYTEHVAKEVFPPIILLAMEDVTETVATTEMLAAHADQTEAKFAEQIQKLKDYIGTLEQENNELKKKLQVS